MGRRAVASTVDLAPVLRFLSVTPWALAPSCSCPRQPATPPCPARLPPSPPDAAPWLLSLGMLAGRLEIPLLVLPFTRDFWRA